MLDTFKNQVWNEFILEVWKLGKRSINGFDNQSVQIDVYFVDLRT